MAIGMFVPVVNIAVYAIVFGDIADRLGMPKWLGWCMLLPVANVFIMPYLARGKQPTAADVIAHLEHAIEVAGEDHVCLGTDGVISPTLKSTSAQLPPTSLFWQAGRIFTARSPPGTGTTISGTAGARVTA